MSGQQVTIKLPEKGMSRSTLTSLVVFCLIFAFSGWIAGMLIAVIALFFEYLRKLRFQTDKKNLPSTIQFSLEGNALHWQPMPSRQIWKIDSDIIKPSICGFAASAAFGWLSIRQNVTPFWVATVMVSSSSIPLLLHWLKPRRFYDWWFYDHVKRTTGLKEAELIGFEKLRKLEIAILEVKEKRGINTPTNYLEQFDNYLRENPAAILRDWSQALAYSAVKAIEATGELKALTVIQEKKSEPGREAPQSNRMTKDLALKILGLKNGASFLEISNARREAIKNYNVDHRQNLEPHIRDLVEEKFKQVNAAFDFLKAESHSS